MGQDGDGVLLSRLGSLVAKVTGHPKIAETIENAGEYAEDKFFKHSEEDGDGPGHVVVDEVLTSDPDGKSFIQEKAEQLFAQLQDDHTDLPDLTEEENDEYQEHLRKALMVVVKAEARKRLGIKLAAAESDQTVV